MGMTAKNIASRYGIGRNEQDEIGALSHQMALAAIKEGVFSKATVPVTIRQRKGESLCFAARVYVVVVCFITRQYHGTSLDQYHLRLKILIRLSRYQAPRHILLCCNLY